MLLMVDERSPKKVMVNWKNGKGSKGKSGNKVDETNLMRTIKRGRVAKKL